MPDRARGQCAAADARAERAGNGDRQLQSNRETPRDAGVPAPDPSRTSTGSSDLPPRDPATGELIVPMRLQRFLARAGAASRRGSEDLMTAGRVRVNGEVACELGTKVDPARDVVTVDGVRVQLGTVPVYLMLNKPAGYLTTMRDPQGRPCVASLVPTDRYPGLFPVGRLDKDTTGLLLFTTDGDLAQDLLHPSKHVSKTYVALVDGKMHDRELNPLRRGIVLDDGPCQPACCRILDDAEAAAVAPDGIPAGTTAVEVIIREGRKNQVKRMLGKIRHPVLRLHRNRFGSLPLTGVAEGSWRLLTDDEARALKTRADVEGGADGARAVHGERGSSARQALPSRPSSGSHSRSGNRTHPTTRSRRDRS